MTVLIEAVGLQKQFATSKWSVDFAEGWPQSSGSSDLTAPANDDNENDHRVSRADPAKPGPAVSTSSRRRKAKAMAGYLPEARLPMAR
jgi:hypothetical protein